MDGAHFEDLIISFPLIAHDSKFVFIPGPTDPAGAIVNILPKPALPKVATQEFLAKLPEAKFASNPCRYLVYLFKKV